MTIEDYMNLPYTKIIEELNESLDEAMEGWLYVKLTRGLHIPLPQEQKAVNF